MPTHIRDISSSTSVSIFNDKREFSPDGQFRWNSIYKFIYMAITFSTTIYNFDMYSRVLYNVRIFEYVLFETTFGMAYMFMDCFTKLYTRKLDAYKHLNPLLKGITYGLFLQTAFWTLIHAVYVADSLRFLATSLKEKPSWLKCHSGVSCISMNDILLRCQENKPTYFNTTSAHYNYQKLFRNRDRSIVTTRLFVVGLVWLFNFFFATVTEETLLKIFNLAFLCQTFTTITTLMLLVFTTRNNAVTAFTQMLDADAPYNITSAMAHVTYTFGIGFLDFYDFGTLSSYTLVDNAVIIFTIVYTVISFMRSWTMKIMYMGLKKCVEIDFNLYPATHYLIFAVLPFSTEFLRMRKLYPIYIYFNLITSTAAYLVMLTLTMARLLQTEFRSLKNMYLVGLLCFLGFGLSLPMIIVATTTSHLSGIVAGVDVIVLYLGGLKSAVVMWLYGVRKFSTDIHFWLGFKPTKFWKISWTLLPIVLTFFFIMKLYELLHMSDTSFVLSAAAWIAISFLVPTIIQIKTIVGYMVRNNLTALFKCNRRYGPPELEERQRRRIFNETIHLRRCKHNCQLLDDNIDCNHMPIMAKILSSGSIVSDEIEKYIFKERVSTVRLKTSGSIDFTQQ